MRLPKQSEYPKELHFGEETYTIRFIRRMPKDDGDCNPATHKIRIRSGMSKARMYRAFVHECLHAIEFEYDIKISHKLVYQLERAICDTILMNSGLSGDL